MKMKILKELKKFFNSQKIFQRMKKNECITKRELEEFLNVKPRKLNRLIKQLLNS